MKIKEADSKLKSELALHFDEREVNAISKIFWDDLFGYRGGIDRYLHTKEIEIYQTALERLRQGEPIQYVTEVSYFYNTKLFVNRNVLIPRPETEELVHAVLSDEQAAGSRVLDIGTGSGCIAIALKKKRSDFVVSAIDKSTEALQVARINAEKNEVKIRFSQMDFMSELAWENFGLFDLIVSNPPYVSQGEKSLMSKSTVKYEPDLALFPDHEDVLIFYKKIARFAKEHLAEKGRIYLECNEFNANQVAGLFDDAIILQDMQAKDRIVVVAY